jgi:hypothetical protein
LTIAEVTCPSSSALTAGTLPENGTKVMSTFAARLSISRAICCAVAGPTLALVNAPGCARAAAK